MDSRTCLRSGRRAATFLAAFAAAGASFASAQHANTVLFGEANPDGLALPAERQAVHPISAPYFHEDSFVTTDLRAWYVRHEFGSTLGGRATVAALQVRAALTESIQFVAYKDGLVDFDVPGLDESGLNDLAAGIKWAFLQDWENDTHAAVGIGYELGIGDEDVLQDDDELRLWASFNQGYDRLHLGATANFYTTLGGEANAKDVDRMSFHLHADYHVNELFSPVVEVNAYTSLAGGGDDAPLGVDVANLGSGEDVITGVLGFEARPAEALAVRLGYESPLTDNVDLFGYRWTLSAVWSF